MKLFLLLIVFILTQGISLKAQCTSDPYVADTDNPGELFPLSFTLRQGIPANLIMTVLPPPTAVAGPTTFNLTKIVLRNLDRKPSWLNYTSNANWVASGNTNPTYGYEFITGNRYCVKLTGTPDIATSGLDSMNVMVDAYVVFGLLAENSNGGALYYRVCPTGDTTCIPTQGEILPSQLQFNGGVPLNNTKVSYVPSSQYSHQGTTLNLSKFVLKSISGMPAWMSYSVNTNMTASGYSLEIGKKYSITLNGTPSDAASLSDTLKLIGDIYNTATNPALITSNIVFAKIPFKSCITGDASCNPTHVELIPRKIFSLLESNSSFPQDITKLGFTAFSESIYTLNIYSPWGQVIYSETKYCNSGTNFFEYSADNIAQGFYVYTISTGNARIAGKFVKTQ